MIGSLTTPRRSAYAGDTACEQSPRALFLTGRIFYTLFRDPAFVLVSPRRGLRDLRPTLANDCSSHIPTYTDIAGECGCSLLNGLFVCGVEPLCTMAFWSQKLDLHQRSREAADLQSAAIAAMRFCDMNASVLRCTRSMRTLKPARTVYGRI